jgi:peptidoglycan hydrolase CwlO-like protein
MFKICKQRVVNSPSLGLTIKFNRGVNMKITVGQLEDMLRKFDKGTIIHSNCNNCNHSTNGEIKITDRTNQTYGYIEIEVNNSNDARIECAADEKEFYEKEIEKLKSELRDCRSKLETYNGMTDQIKKNIERYEYYIKR